MLRRRMTEAERRLWAKLRNRGVTGAKFRRQVPIGPFVADFACVERSLVIEIDGGHHADREEDDAARTESLTGFGYSVLRFWNSEVLSNLEGVLAAIAAAVDARTDCPHPGPLPRAGEGGTRAAGG
jgi:very-short-patch-repair endonuclease